MRRQLVQPLRALLLLLLVLVRAGLLPGPAPAEAAPEVEQKFIPFVTKGGQVQEGSIINVPTYCPSNMLKVGNRCRTVY